MDFDDDEDFDEEDEDEDFDDEDDDMDDMPPPSYHLVPMMPGGGMGPGGGPLVSCPVCGQMRSMYAMNDHLDANCEGYKPTYVAPVKAEAKRVRKHAQSATPCRRCRY